MAVEQHNVVDFIRVEPCGDTVLTVSDHLPWHEVNEHLFCLQEKLNAYLRFVENGEIYQKWPNAVGHPILIGVVTKFPPPEGAAWFFQKTAAMVHAAGFKFIVR